MAKSKVVTVKARGHLSKLQASPKDVTLTISGLKIEGGNKEKFDALLENDVDVEIIFTGEVSNLFINTPDPAA